MPPERENFKIKNPELFVIQEQESRRSLKRLITIISIGVSVIVGTKYALDEEFSKNVDSAISKIGVSLGVFRESQK